MFKFIPILILLTLSTLAADINELCRKGLKTYNYTQKLQDENNKATQELNNKSSNLYSSQRTLKKGFSKEEMDRIQKDIESLKKSIADYERYIKKNKSRLENKEDLISLSKLSKEEQTSKLKEIDKEIKEIREQISSISQPYRDKINAAKKLLSKSEKDFEVFMKKQFVTSEKLGIDKVQVNPGLASAFTSVSWYKGDKRVLWAHVRMRDLPEEDDFKREKLFGKYTASSFSDSQIWYWAGHFQVAFIPDGDEYRGKDKLQEAVKELIKSEALAAIKAK